MLKGQTSQITAVLDSKIRYKKRVFIYVNNILDEIYSETNLVPMPGRKLFNWLQCWNRLVHQTDKFLKL